MVWNGTPKRPPIWQYVGFGWPDPEGLSIDPVGVPAMGCRPLFNEFLTLRKSIDRTPPGPCFYELYNPIQLGFAPDFLLAFLGHPNPWDMGHLGLVRATIARGSKYMGWVIVSFPWSSLIMLLCLEFHVTCRPMVNVAPRELVIAEGCLRVGLVSVDRWFSRGLWAGAH